MLQLLLESLPDTSEPVGAVRQFGIGDCVSADGSCRVRRPLCGYCETARHTVSSETYCVLAVASDQPASAPRRTNGERMIVTHLEDTMQGRDECAPTSAARVS